jgi:hypothetical protein
MNTSGEAADQVVRMSLEAGEAALKISGTGAQQLAVLLYTILKEQKKTKGRARLETLVRSGKPLTVFSVKESDLKQFVQEAKRYGILYCAVRDPKGSRDGMVDIMVKEEDAPRINRIVERFQFASVTEAAQIKTEIQKSREEKSHAKAKRGKTEKGKVKSGIGKEERVRTGEVVSNAPDELQKAQPEKLKEEQLLDELLGTPAKKEETKQKNPSLAKTEKSHPSEPISGKQGRSAGGTSKPYRPQPPEKPSVRRELREIQATRKKEAESPKRETSARNSRAKSQKPLQHRQPQAKRKSRKGRER